MMLHLTLIEIVGDYTNLKLHNDQPAIIRIRQIYGDDFADALEKQYQNNINDTLR